MGLKRTSHSVYDTRYHLVWCPKYRKKIFERVEVRERAKQMIREICEAYDIEILEMEIMKEHIHSLTSGSRAERKRGFHSLGIAMAVS